MSLVAGLSRCLKFQSQMTFSNCLFGFSFRSTMLSILFFSNVVACTPNTAKNETAQHSCPNVYTDYVLKKLQFYFGCYEKRYKQCHLQ